MQISTPNLNKKPILSGLAKSYSPLDYCHKMANDLKTVFPNEDFSNLSKYQLHQRINTVLSEGYNGEHSIKYFLFNKFRDKDLIAAYETKVQNSRLDFLTVNGVTTSYEIKSSLDKLDKLAKQSSDYLKAFEFNCLIIDQRHLEKVLLIVPKTFGIWIFDGVKVKKYRKPIKNQLIEPYAQLNLLNKKELNYFFGKACRNNILDTISAREINNRFKKALKARYSDRWSFLVANCQQILPIDVQFFFNININPRHIYQF